MTENETLIALAKKTQLQNYRPAPFVLHEGRGCRVFDVEGRSFLDLCAGIAVLSVGHCHPRLAAAIAEQATRLMHVSNLFYNDQAILLADALTRRTGFGRAFFCNSGAEANEAMLKLARRHHYDRGQPEKVEFLSFEHSFHGRTMGALAVTGQAKYHEGMEPLIGGVHTLPFGDLAAVEAVIGPRTAAVIVEPIQGEGGIRPATDDFLRGLRSLCDAHGALLLFDEVQTGYGRTGRFLAREHSGVWPDACSLAKGIAGGFPLGAMLVDEKLALALPPGSHATTFGGNPLACAAGLAVLAIFDDEDLVAKSETVGAALGEKLRSMTEDGALFSVVEARGVGLLRGVLLDDSVDAMATLAAIRDRGVLLSIAGGNVLRFSPPLTVTEAELDEGLATVREVLARPPLKASAATPAGGKREARP